jgi:hypothetical protein
MAAVIERGKSRMASASDGRNTIKNGNHTCKVKKITSRGFLHYGLDNLAIFCHVNINGHTGKLTLEDTACEEKRDKLQLYPTRPVFYFFLHENQISDQIRKNKAMITYANVAVGAQER